jgi:hypothetical protein
VDRGDTEHATNAMNMRKFDSVLMSVCVVDLPLVNEERATSWMQQRIKTTFFSQCKVPGWDI